MGTNKILTIYKQIEKMKILNRPYLSKYAFNEKMVIYL